VSSAFHSALVDMHLIFSSLLLAFHLLLVVAQDPDCQTKFAGILSAQVGGNLKSFTPATSIVNDSVAYVGNGKSPYVVQFQVRVHAIFAVATVNLG